MRDALRGERGGERRRDASGCCIDGGVDTGVGEPERLDPRRDRERIPAEGAGLVDGPERRQQLHEVRASPDAGKRHAAADDLPEGEEVGHVAGAASALVAPPSGGVDPEPGEHLVEDEQRPLAVRRLDEEVVEAVFGREDAGVCAGALRDDRGDAPGMRGERVAHRRTVVVRQDQGEPRDRRGDAGGARKAERGHARSGFGEQPVGVAVVVAGELDDHVSPGRTPRDADGGHRGLGARGHQAQSLDPAGTVDGEALHDELGELGLPRRGGAERQTARGRALHGVDHPRVGVPQQGGSPRRDEIHVLAPRHIRDRRAVRRDDRQRRAADRSEGPHRRVHPARDDGAGTCGGGLVGESGIGGAHASFQRSAASTAQYVSTASAPARTMAVRDSSIARSRSIHPCAAAASIIAYSPLT